MEDSRALAVNIFMFYKFEVGSLLQPEIRNANSRGKK